MAALTTQIGISDADAAKFADEILKLAKEWARSGGEFFGIYASFSLWYSSFGWL